ncbi:protein notum-like [Tropilaelaps mercedesae]|uniref:Protein notum-like n=1 Tax=Tropilaelaps mercedesae TaxID=418985 RepID=A0A1V9Y048_9ACAR|nr:protein notum-like [Tropilaelaps mercedesae]
MPLLLAAAALLALLAPSKSDLLRDPQAQLPHPGLTGMDMAKLLATVVKTDSATTTVPSSVQVISQIAQAYQASRNASRLKETSQLDHNGYLTDSRTKEKEHPQQNLRRVLLHNTTAMCNDGSPAGSGGRMRDLRAHRSHDARETDRRQQATKPQTCHKEGIGAPLGKA